MTVVNNNLPDSERLARFCLARTPSVGAITFRRLLERFGSAERALEALPNMARRGGKAEAFEPFSQGAARTETDRLQRLGGQWLVWGDAAYPAPLAAVEDAPPVLSVLGDGSLLNKPCVAMVGARNASLAGQQFAKTLAQGLGKAGCIVVSGLARGVDTAAHQAALATGTIGVVAGGVDVIYPAENEKLQQAMAKQGAVVAESALGVQPIAQLFPRRNRIIAGLSLATIVVEATLKSGSLITARMAADYGREVLAVPGHPMDPRSGGPNALIRDGAHIVRGVEDVMDVLAGLKNAAFVAQETASPFTSPTSMPVPQEEIDRLRDLIYTALSFEPMPIDGLVAGLGAPPAFVQIALLELELAGRAVRYPGGRVARAAEAEVAESALLL